MKYILILSDTHGLLREEVKALLAQADVVIHAGDINTPAIVDTRRLLWIHSGQRGRAISSGATTIRIGRRTCPTA